MLPFHKRVYDARPFVYARRTVHLELEAVVEVLKAVAVGIEAYEAQVETAVCGLCLAVVVRIFSDDVAAEFEFVLNAFELLFSLGDNAGFWSFRLGSVGFDAALCCEAVRRFFCGGGECACGKDCQ